MGTNNGCSRSRDPSNNRALHRQGPGLRLMLACHTCRAPPRHSHVCSKHMGWALTIGPPTPFDPSWYILRTKHLTLRNMAECPECPLTYIGETGRTLATRMKDHLNLRNSLTAVGEHCAHEHHKITEDSVKVIAREDVWAKRKMREAIEIKIGQPAMNHDHCRPGVRAPPPPNLRWTSAVMWSSSRLSHDLGGWGT